jgi:hypothetical protein
MSRDPQLKLGDDSEQSTSTSRDLERERGFLLDAARGREQFVTDVVERLTAGAVEYDDSWRWCGLSTLLREAREEGSDLAGWSVLAVQAADRDHRLSEVQRGQLAAILAVVARHGAAAHESLTAGLRIVEGLTS